MSGRGKDGGARSLRSSSPTPLGGAKGAAPADRVGIVGGGQLASMMIDAARRLGIRTVVLDPDPAAPAMRRADEAIVGGVHDPEALARLAVRVDVVTFDLENVGTDTLDALTRAGHRVQPSPALMARLRDKYEQRSWFRDAGIPVPRFADVDGRLDDAIGEFGYPVVQKARRGGYDGRGVTILRSPADLERALPGETYLEEWIDIERELAVLIAVGQDGERAVYPAIETVQTPDTHVLDHLVVPAPIDEAVRERAVEVAHRVVDCIADPGLYAVEMMVARGGRVVVTEVAPRPHNSGHVTIEACATSQFEQHLRAVTGRPLGPTTLRSPAATVNLLAGGSGSGTARVRGAVAARSLPGVHVHLYGKEIARPGRKMGHLTAVAEDPSRALATAKVARDRVVVDAEPEPSVTAATG